VVAAPDHSEMTLFDREDALQSAAVWAMLLRFRLDGLDVRAKDVEGVIGRLLAADRLRRSREHTRQDRPRAWACSATAWDR
jgi:hypothetical protein